MRHKTMQDVIEREILPALGTFADDFDVEGLAAATFTLCIDTDEHGNQLLNTAGFEQSVTGPEFWVVAERYDRTLRAEQGQV